MNTTIFERLGAYFTENRELNIVTGTLIPTILQIVAVVSPDLADTTRAAFGPDTNSMLLHGGVGAIAALVIVVLGYCRDGKWEKASR